jgi:2-keto-4-pentenoate hydratase/2-oxohepta-3-ene-1,7-dioic acid hydratase in catechol pathway
VRWPAYSNWIDYELEIAAVIGRRGRDIRKEEADQYIFGYTIMNDLSARDAQQLATATGLSITAKGKDFTGSYPLGPCIVTKDELDVANLQTVLRVNDEEWGRGSTSGRHWTFNDGIAYASQDCDLIPGEILTSATVPNCAGYELARKGRRGDCVEVEVAGIGVLRTWID